MTGVAISTPHHYGGNIIEPHTSASATMLHELRQCVVDGSSFSKEATQLEWLGFSWLTGGRGLSHLDVEGNPYVYLSRINREVDGEGGGDSEDEDGGDTWANPKEDNRLHRGADADADGDGSSKEVGKSQGEVGAEEKGKQEAKQQPPISFWTENDLNISDVQGVKMWDKAIWAGRL